MTGKAKLTRTEARALVKDKEDRDEMEKRIAKRAKRAIQLALDGAEDQQS